MPIQRVSPTWGLCCSLALISSLAFAAEEAAEKSASTTAPSKSNFVSRHFKFVSVDGVSRFRYVDKGPGAVTDRDLQYKLSTRVQLDLAPEGKTYIQARGESGRSFQSSWDYAGPGPNKAYWSFNLKSLYAGQKIGSHFEAQAGGIEYDWGAGTEATYADNDGWLEGYRLRYTGSGKHWTPDKISATVGYAGDFLQPNAFARLYRMGDENYIQILASRKFNKTREISSEFDSIQAIRYNRDGVRLQKLPLVIIDELSAEALVRASDNPSFGWSGSLYRTLDKKGRLRLGVFYCDMPKGIFLKGKSTIFINGDSYQLGKRIGPTVRLTPYKDFEVSLFGSDRLDRTAGTRYRGQVVVRYQLAGLLNRAMR